MDADLREIKQDLRDLKKEVTESFREIRSEIFKQTQEISDIKQSQGSIESLLKKHDEQIETLDRRL